uniref:Import inner membrane translocase subunit n=1 Tax=Kalanchoe fedtschenkoi TaxID=63787 RepID=A0A7N0TJR7_KALFE
MAKASSKLPQNALLLKLRFPTPWPHHHHISKSTPQNPHLLRYVPSPRPFSTSTPATPSSVKQLLPPFSSNPCSNFRSFATAKLLGLGKPSGGSVAGMRHISFKAWKLPGGGGSQYAKTVTDKPVKAVRSAVSRYKEAVGLQIEAFWRNNYMVLLGVAGMVVCVFLWKIMFGIANTFIGLSEGMAKYGFLALSTAVVAFTGLYIRSRLSINPDRVYRMAMRKLNTDAGILEVMGAPLTGTDLRAYVMSGGGFRLKNFKPVRRSKRCFLIFPIQGSERKGLVNVEVKKRKGEYDMKLLAVDVPMAGGKEQRLYLIGDEEEYKVGGGLIAELRDPVVKAMAAAKEFEALDQKEDKEDAERELQEEERKHQEEIEKLHKSDKQ